VEREGARGSAKSCPLGSVDTYILDAFAAGAEGHSSLLRQKGDGDCAQSSSKSASDRSLTRDTGILELESAEMALTTGLEKGCRTSQESEGACRKAMSLEGVTRSRGASGGGGSGTEEGWLLTSISCADMISEVLKMVLILAEATSYTVTSKSLRPTHTISAGSASSGSGSGSEGSSTSYMPVLSTTFRRAPVRRQRPTAEERFEPANTRPDASTKGERDTRSGTDMAYSGEREEESSEADRP
jgi:hypothetical protein